MNENRTERNLGGRPRAEVSQEAFGDALRRFRAHELTMEEAAAACGIGRSAFYRRVKEAEEPKKSFVEVLKDDVSSLNTEQLRMIPVEQLQPDPNNFYSMTGLEELAESIEFIGLQQPLRVRKNGEAYTIVSGHRRLGAILLIRETNPEAFSEGVPCLIDSDASPLMQELRLIYANASTRVLSAAEMSRQAERVEDLLYQLKEQGVEFPGRMRDHVAAACQASASRIARLHAIRKNLSTPLRPYFENGELPEGLAYRLSQLPRPLQTDIQMKLGRTVCDLTGSQLETVIEQAAKEKQKQEEPPAEAPAATPEDLYRPDSKVSEYLEQRAAEDDAFFEMLNEEADSFFYRMASFPSRQTGIARLKEAFGRDHVSWLHERVDVMCSPKGVRLWDINGPTDWDISRTWTDVYDMLCAIGLNRAAMITGDDEEDEEEEAPVSRMGPAAEPAWQTGTPPRPGRYFCRVDMDTTKPIENRCDWDGKEWTVYGVKLQEKWKIVGWWPLPKEG